MATPRTPVKDTKDFDKCSACSTRSTNEDMINCDKCEKLYHFICVKYKPENEGEEWICPECTLNKRSTDGAMSKEALAALEEDIARIEREKLLVQKRIQLMRELNQLRIEEEQMNSVPTLISTITAASSTTESKTTSFLPTTAGGSTSTPMTSTAHVEVKTPAYFMNPFDVNEHSTVPPTGGFKFPTSTTSDARLVPTSLRPSAAPFPSIGYEFPALCPVSSIVATTNTLPVYSSAVSELQTVANINSVTTSSRPRRYEASARLTSAHIASRKALKRDLPSFSGDPEEWPIFISNYEMTTIACN